MLHQTGTRLPALEKNILKYRALEMVLILFYTEQLRQLIIGTIEATGKIRAKLGASSSPTILPETKKKFRVALDALLADGVITKMECNEIPRLVDYRNRIAHEIHTLTCDIGQTRSSEDLARHIGLNYNYDALKRLKYYNESLPRLFMTQYIISLSFDDILFEATAKTYDEELKRLHRRITVQLEQRKERLHHSAGCANANAEPSSGNSVC